MSNILSSKGRALLAPAIILLAAVSACAQDTSGARGATPDSHSDATRTEVQTGQRAQTGHAASQSGTTRAPMTADEKISRAFRHAFFSPTPYVMSALSAAYTEWREDKPPNKTTGDEFADWGSRTARNFATSSTKALFAYGFYPALLRQDPRYEPSQSKQRGQRNNRHTNSSNNKQRTTGLMAQDRRNLQPVSGRV